MAGTEQVLLMCPKSSRTGRRDKTGPKRCGPSTAADETGAGTVAYTVKGLLDLIPREDAGRKDALAGLRTATALPKN